MRPLEIGKPLLWYSGMASLPDNVKTKLKTRRRLNWAEDVDRMARPQPLRA